MAKRTISLILIMVLLVFCVSSLAEGVVTTDFSKEELLADYDQLWDILEESYPFLPVLAERGINPQTYRLDNRAMLESRVKDLKGFYWLLQDMLRLRRADSLAHLVLVSAELFKTYQTVAAKYDRPEHSIVLNPQTEAAYSALGADVNPYEYAEALPMETDYFPEERAAYFRFPTFATSMVQMDGNPLAEALAAYPDAEHVIIDITGNNGGYNGNWQYAIVSAFSEQIDRKAPIFVRDTPAAAPFYLDVPLLPIAELPKEIEKPAFADTFGMTHFAIDTVTFPLADYTGIQESRPLQRWLLVDAGVYSAADSFAQFCKDTGWATLVGSTTYGGGTVRPIMVRLDNTGLLVHFSVDSAVNQDDSPNAVYGTMPDHFSESGEMPLKTCLWLIKNQP